MKYLLYAIFAVVVFSSCGDDPVFGTEKYVIKVDIDGQGKVKGAGAFSYGDYCSLTAVPDSVNGYRFESWLQLPENVVVSTEKSYSFEVDESRTLKVVFSK